MTLANSRRAAPGSTTLRRPNEIVTASKVPSANGRCSASPATLGCRISGLAAASMPSEKSVATHQAPEPASAVVETPVPAATSRARWPGSSCSARTVCRRAERSAWAAHAEYAETMNELAIKYLNRLSDLLFILARHANRENGDVLWVPGGERGGSPK